MTSVERFTLTGNRNPPGSQPLIGLTTPAGALARRDRGEGSSTAMSARARPVEPPDDVLERRQSSYLNFLPGVYLKNEFLGRFLLIFESILDPLDRQVGQLHAYFDPRTAPGEVLSWIGSWFGLVMDSRIPEERRRDLVESASEIFAWRGTKRGLSLLLRLTLGVEPEITEPPLTDVTRDPANFAWRFTVRLALPADEPLDDEFINQLIDQNRPAACAAEIQITRATARGR